MEIEFRLTLNDVDIAKAFNYFFSVFFRQPIIWHETKPCNKYHEGAICDYQEFRNLGNDANNKEFEIVTSNEFDLTMIKFWDDILKL